MLVVSFFDTLHTVLGGICKGLALQKVAAILVLVSYYIIGVPVGYYLAFYTDFKLQGLWMGLFSGAVIATVLLTIVLCKAKWKADTIDKFEIRMRHYYAPPKDV
jgi:MATE family multidrug resistance protein